LFQLIKGDCLAALDTVKKESVQLTFTSPPYADLIHKVEEDRTKRHKNSAFVVENNSTTSVYSDDEKDLGNMPLDKYTKVVKQIMKKVYAKTKKGGYNIWVVKDYRDMQNNVPYVDLHSIIANAGIKAGFKYHDLIIWDQNEHRKLVLLGYPSRFYVNQNHSYLVVLRKW
jgi:DNA modification methylase